MLDHFSIFTRGGLVLWTFQLTALKGSPIEALIQTCLLQERSGETNFNYGRDAAAYTLKWTFNNELGLVFVAVYQRILQLLYVEGLLAAVKSAFVAQYDPSTYDYPGFKDTFQQLLLEAESRSRDLTRPQHARTFESTKKGQAVQSSSARSKKGAGASSKKQGGGKSKASGEDSTDDASGYSTGEVGGDEKEKYAAGKSDSGSDEDPKAPPPSSKSGAFDLSKLRNRASRGKGQNGPSVAAASKKGAKGIKEKVASDSDAGDDENKEGEKNKKKGKPMRKWEDGSGDEKGKWMDFSEGEEMVTVVDVKTAGKSLMDAEEEEEDVEWDSEDSGEEIEMETPSGQVVERANGTALANGVGAPGPVKPKSSWLTSLFHSVAGKPALEAEDLAPALKSLKDRLMSKNVAEEIAEQLCRSVSAGLVGKKLSSFTRVSTAVQSAMEEALLRILTPRRSIDILRDVQAVQEQKQKGRAGYRPYVITFVGVNGVGKSTNLAKVAYWLTQHGVSVMLAACDTFRAGAVEQLRTHARRLQVPLFEKGYEKDPAAVARDAIKEAQRTGIDAVLVDTAGRMQDNEPLMRALSKLISLNSPDLVLFVGEALVGNDGVDQLSKFNQRLTDLAPSSNGANPSPNKKAINDDVSGGQQERLHAVDGILLTKFDTIDDKVGATLSMVYISGAPIMFLGCGQTYTDLKRLNVKQIIKVLLK